MYLSDARRLLVRRWHLAAVGIMATVALMFVVMRIVPPDYEATADVLLLPPRIGTETGSNPFLSLGGLQSSTDVVARAMMSEDSIAAIRTAGGNDDFTVETDRSTSGPLLLVKSVDNDPGRAIRTLDLVVERIPITLAALQAADNVQPSFQITSSVVTQQQTPTVERKSQVRALLVAAAVGLAGSLFVIALIDGWVIRRQTRQQELSESDARLADDTQRGDNQSSVSTSQSRGLEDQLAAQDAVTEKDLTRDTRSASRDLDQVPGR